MFCFLSLCLPIVQGLICLCLLWCPVHCDSRFHSLFFIVLNWQFLTSHFLPLGFILSVILTVRSITPSSIQFWFNLISELATSRFLDLIIAFSWYIHIMLLCTFIFGHFSTIYNETSFDLFSCSYTFSWPYFTYCAL
jgi:hypothetical protein